MIYDKEWEISMVIAARKGDMNAFEELYRSYYEKIFALSKLTVKNIADAEDVLQITFVRAWQNLDKLENPAAFGTWLQRIAINQCNSMLRKKKPDLSIDEENEYGEVIQIESDLELPEQYAERDDLSLRLRNVIDELSIVQKETILLYYFNEMSVEEISEIMDCSQGTVKSRLYLARKAIKTEIEEQEKRTGERFYGITGVALIPFGWLFVRQIQSSTISSSAATSIFEQISVSIAKSSAGYVSSSDMAEEAAKAFNNVSSEATKHTVVAVTKSSIPIWGKIVAGIIAIGIVTSGSVFTWKTLTNRKSSIPESTEALSILQDGTPREQEVSSTTKASDVIEVDPTDLPDSLTFFFNQFDFAFNLSGDGNRNREYDYSNLADVYNTLVSYIACNPSCVNLFLYPGEKTESDWVNGSDPLGKFTDTGYLKVEESKVIWVLQNVFNISEQDSKGMVTAALNNDDYLYEYEQNGKNYLFNKMEGMGDVGTDVVYETVRFDGEKYYIVYNLSFGNDGIHNPNSIPDETYYAEVSLKEYDGNSYWSLYRHTKNIPELPAVTSDSQKKESDYQRASKVQNLYSLYEDLSDVNNYFRKTLNLNIDDLDYFRIYNVYPPTPLELYGGSEGICFIQYRESEQSDIKSIVFYDSRNTMHPLELSVVSEKSGLDQIVSTGSFEREKYVLDVYLISDKKGNALSIYVCSNGTGFGSVYSYNSNGQISEMNTYKSIKKDSILDNNDISETPYFNCIFSYNTDGSLKRSDITYNTEKKINQINTDYFYDKKGNRSRCNISSNVASKTTYTWTLEYFRDNTGLVIKERSTIGSSSFNTYIAYYSDGLSYVSAKD